MNNNNFTGFKSGIIYDYYFTYLYVRTNHPINTINFTPFYTNLKSGETIFSQKINILNLLCTGRLYSKESEMYERLRIKIFLSKKYKNLYADTIKKIEFINLMGYRIDKNPLANNYMDSSSFKKIFSLNKAIRSIVVIGKDKFYFPRKILKDKYIIPYILFDMKYTKNNPIINSIRLVLKGFDDDIDYHIYLSLYQILYKYITEKYKIGEMYTDGENIKWGVPCRLYQYIEMVVNRVAEKIGSDSRLDLSQYSSITDEELLNLMIFNKIDCDLFSQMEEILIRYVPYDKTYEPYIFTNDII